MRNLLISLAAVLLGFNATAQTTQKLSATKLSEFGIIYRLPSTVIDITIEAERTVRHPGEFHRYAVKYFGTTERVVTADEESWTLKSVTLSAHGEAVDTLSYLAQFKAGTAATMIVNEQMIPLALNTDKTLTLPTTDLPVARAAQPTPLQSEAAREVMSEEMMQSQSLAKRAEIAANMLFSLRQSRTEIISGQAETMPPDGQALRLVLDRIDAAFIATPCNGHLPALHNARGAALVFDMQGRYLGTLHPEQLRFGTVAEVLRTKFRTPGAYIVGQGNSLKIVK